MDNIYVTTIVYNYKLFNIYTNMEGTKTFFEFKDNSLVRPSQNDQDSLNRIFNPSILVMNGQNNYPNEINQTEPSNKKKSNHFLSDIQHKIWAIGLSVVITSAGLHGIIAHKGHMSLSKAYLNSFIAAETNIADIFTSDDKMANDLFKIEVEKRIMNNSNLFSTEKEFFIDRFSQILLNYGNYMRQQHVLRNLKNMDIVYKQDIDEDYIYQNRNSSAQCLFGYEINVFNAENFEQASKGTIAHEFMHILHGRVKNSRGRFIQEGLTSEFINEYVINDNEYSIERMLTGLLLELVDKDTLLNCYFECDYDELINKLMEITNDKSEVIRFISLGDIINSLNSEILKGQIDINNNNETEESLNYENNKASLKQALDEFISIYEKYYIAKTSQSPKNNIYIAACIDCLGKGNNLEINPELLKGLNLYFVKRNYLQDSNIINLYVEYGENYYLKGNLDIDVNSSYSRMMIENAYGIFKEAQKSKRLD